MSDVLARLLSGAAFGARAWAIYGFVEIWFLVVQPWLLEPRVTYRPIDIWVNITVLALYVAIGAFAGAAFAFVLQQARVRGGQWARIPPTSADAAAGAASLLFAASLNAVAGGSDPRHVAYSLACLAAALTVLLPAIVGRPKLISLAASPWLVALLLLYPAWVAAEVSPFPSFRATQRIAALLAMAAAIGALVWVAQKIAPGAVPSARAAAKSLVFVVLLAIATAVCGHYMRPQILVKRAFPPPSSRPLPNIILISLDTVRADHLSVYGYTRDTTPRLRALAAEATVFGQAISASDYTLPSHASMFTGLYASEHGAHFWEGPQYDAPLSAPYPLLAELLSQNGYAAAGVVANHGFLSHEFGFDRGFQAYDERPPPAVLPLYPRYCLRNGLRVLIAGSDGTSPLTRDYRRAAEINASAEALLDQPAFTAGAFFLFINYMDAHAPYDPPPPFAGGFPRANDDRSRAVAKYDGGIAYLDSQLGRLLDRLKTLNLYDRSLIMITSDHGEAFGERGYWQHQHSVYQDQVHVPLIVKYPGQRTGRRIQEPVSGVDVAPTLLGAAGLAAPPNMQGRQLTESGGAATAVLFAEHFSSLSQRGAPGGGIARAAIAGRLKFVQLANGTRELFDLSIDPTEGHNVYDAANAAHRHLQSLLQGFVQRGEQVKRDNPQPGGDAIERLRSLGYAGR